MLFVVDQAVNSKPPSGGGKKLSIYGKYQGIVSGSHQVGVGKV